MDDPENGRLLCKGSWQENYGLTETVWFNFSLTVEVKDGRYRWTVDQVYYAPNGGKGAPIEGYLNKDGVGKVGLKAVFERFRQHMLELGEEVGKAMNATKGDDF